MNYESFKAEVEQKFLGFMPKEYQGMKVRISQTIKVNEKLDGLTLIDKSDNAGARKTFPTIYINHMYEDYMLTMDFDDCMKRVARAMVRALNEAPAVDISDLTFEKRKESIVFQLISYKQNEEMLRNVPHRRVLDLAIVYRMMVDIGDADAQGSILVNGELIKHFGVTEEELFKEAMTNTKRVLEPRVVDMADLIGAELDAPQEIAELIPRNEMFVITNKRKINGAGSILYEEYLHELADKLDDDLYILPASVHECILVPASDHEPNELLEMVRDVNASEISPSEKLSDEVYTYSRDTRSITIASKH